MKKIIIFCLILSIIIFAAGPSSKGRRYIVDRTIFQGGITGTDSLHNISPDTLMMFLRAHGFTDTLGLADSIAALESRGYITIDSLSTALRLAMSDTTNALLSRDNPTFTNDLTVGNKLTADTVATVKAFILDNGVREMYIKTDVNDTTTIRVDKILAEGVIATTGNIRTSADVIGDNVIGGNIHNLGSIYFGTENIANPKMYKTTMSGGGGVAGSTALVIDSAKVLLTYPYLAMGNGSHPNPLTIDNRNDSTKIYSDNIHFADGYLTFPDGRYISTPLVTPNEFAIGGSSLFNIEADSTYLGKTAKADTLWSNRFMGDLTFSNNRYISAIHGDTLAVFVPVWKSQGKFASMLGYFLDNGFSIVPTSATETTLSGTKLTIRSETNINPHAATSPETSTFIGNLAGKTGATGADNTVLGYNAGSSLTSGAANTLLGMESGSRIGTGSSNVYLGKWAGRYATGSFNSYIGQNTGGSSTSNSGTLNTYLGYLAGFGNTTGAGNSFSGAYSGRGNTTGSFNTFAGDSCGYSNTTGSRNVFLGYKAIGSSATASDQLVIQSDNGSKVQRLLTGNFATGILEADSLMISGAMQDKYSRDSLYTFALADTWYNIKFPQKYDTINEGFFTPNADSTGFVATRAGVAHVDAILHYFWTGAGGTAVSAFQRVVKGRTGSTRVETKCGKNEFLRSNATGDFETLSSCSQFSIAVGDTIFVQSRVTNVGMVLRYATEGVFDSNTTANIIMEYKGK
jgi:hypothetical protein